MVRTIPAVRRWRAGAWLGVAMALAGPRPATGGDVAAAAWPPDAARYDPPGTPVAPGLAVGDVLEQSNASSATGLLPPEILRHYAAGEYRNAIASWPDGIVHHDAAFEQATASNANRYGIDAATGTIVELATGAPATDIYGFPFPQIAPDDPAGGLKAVWNQFHAYWNGGSYRVESSVAWVRGSGFEREATVDSFYQFYENQGLAYRLPNPGGYSSQNLSIVKSPADLQGSVSLGYRYRDPGHQDAVWVYVPALRRVRVVSPSNRSDGMLGTDLSLDDGNFFDAKPEDFTWRTVGLRDGLRLASARGIRGEGASPTWVGNGWRASGEGSMGVAGYQVPGWSGNAWAPATAVLAKRRFWVVEAVPRDPDYLFGRLELWIDAETWAGAWNRKFSWKGEIAATYQILGSVPYPAVRPGATEPEWIPANGAPWQCIEAIPFGRATLAGLRPRPDAPEDFRVRHDVEALFDLQVMTRLGR